MGFLGNVLGPSREEVWRQLCAEIGADFVDGGFWKGDKVQAHVKSWTPHPGHLHGLHRRLQRRERRPVPGVAGQTPPAIQRLSEVLPATTYKRHVVS
jgi:hypothetical protein